MILNCLVFFALLNGFACEDNQLSIPQSEIAAYAVGAGFDESELPIVLCIVFHESSNRPRVVSDNGVWGKNYGLAQINSGWWEGFGDNPPARPDLSPEVLMDPLTNIDVMYYVYKRSSFEAWSVYETNCEK